VIKLDRWLDNHMITTLLVVVGLIFGFVGVMIFNEYSSIGERLIAMVYVFFGALMVLGGFYIELDSIRKYLKNLKHR